MKKRLTLLVCVFPVVAGLMACGGSGGGTVSPPPPDPPSVTISASPATITLGQTTTVTWSATNASSCTASGAWSGSEPTSGTASEKPAATGTATFTLVCSGSGGSAQNSADVTVNQRVITLAIDPSTPIPNSEIYSDSGSIFQYEVDCTGCAPTDTVSILSPDGVTNTYSFSQLGSPWKGTVDTTGYLYEPGLFKSWVSGTDGVTSNTLWFAFDGSENMAVEDPSSGEIYYAYSGNGINGSFSVLKYKQDGTADGNFQDGGFGIAADGKTHNLIFTSVGQVSVVDPNDNELDTVGIPNSSSNAYALAVTAAAGLGCATQPSIDSVSCLEVPESVNDNPQPFTVPGLPSGSAPAAVKVLDANHVVAYGRGNSTLYWFTISGTTATVAGSLQLSDFTAAAASYWQQHPATGGWEMVAVGSTLGVMGQVVNADGTVSQKLALVNNTNQTLTQYVDLPPGTVHIAADPTNNAVVAEYVDFSGSSPILRFERVYVDTGNTMLLTSTSNLVPGAGFLVTNDGSHIAVFVGGKADFEPNQ